MKLTTWQMCNLLFLHRKSIRSSWKKKKVAVLLPLRNTDNSSFLQKVIWSLWRGILRRCQDLLRQYEWDKRLPLTSSTSPQNATIGRNLKESKTGFGSFLFKTTGKVFLRSPVKRHSQQTRPQVSVTKIITLWKLFPPHGVSAEGIDQLNEKLMMLEFLVHSLEVCGTKISCRRWWPRFRHDIQHVNHLALGWTGISIEATFCQGWGNNHEIYKIDMVLTRKEKLNNK